MLTKKSTTMAHLAVVGLTASILAGCFHSKPKKWTEQDEFVKEVAVLYFALNDTSGGKAVGLDGAVQWLQQQTALGGGESGKLTRVQAESFVTLGKECGDFVNKASDKSSQIDLNGPHNNNQFTLSGLPPIALSDLQTQFCAPVASNAQRLLDTGTGMSAGPSQGVNCGPKQTMCEADCLDARGRCDDRQRNSGDNLNCGNKQDECNERCAKQAAACQKGE